MNLQTRYNFSHGSDEVEMMNPVRWNRKDGYSTQVTIFQALGSWKLEFLAASLAVGLLAAIFITLARFNGQDVPNWPANLNLNSLVAIYATLLRALLLFAIAEVISQEKWYWFGRPRPLRNLEDFDLASRGALGSVKLLPVAFSSMVPFIAALTTILLLAIGPFTQQAVKTNLCRRILDSGEQARIPVAAKLPLSDVGLGPNIGPVTIPPPALNAVRAGLTTPSTASTDVLPFTCPTGNCTFPAFGDITHSSLGLCSTCEDLTSTVIQLPRNCPTNETLSYVNCKYFFAPPYAANTTVQIGLDPFMIASSSPEAASISHSYINTVPFDWINVTLLTRSLAGCEGVNGNQGCPNAPKYPNLTALQNPVDFNFTMIGARCSFFPCIKHYNGEIRSGKLNERVVSSSKLAPNFTDNRIETLAGVANPCLVDGNWYDSSNMTLAASKYGEEILNSAAGKTTAPRPCVIKMQNEWMNVLSKEFDQVFTGGCKPVATNKAVILPHTAMFCPNWWISGLWNNGSATFDSIRRQTDNVASAVTNHMRTVGLVWSAVDETGRRPNSSDLAFVMGTTERTDLCIQFDWIWLLLPTGLTFITFSLLIASVLRTCLKNSPMPAWKSSVLPLLFHGFRGRFEPPNHQLQPQEIEQTVKSMTATYAPDERGGGGIVLVDGELRRRHAGGGYEHVAQR